MRNQADAEREDAHGLQWDTPTRVREPVDQA
jgi:hypothetical protein